MAQTCTFISKNDQNCFSSKKASVACCNGGDRRANKLINTMRLQTNNNFCYGLEKNVQTGRP